MTVRGRPADRNTPPDPRRESGLPGHERLLTQRAALILIAALVIGIAAGALTYLAADRIADAVLAGGGTFGAAITALDTLVA